MDIKAKKKEVCQAIDEVWKYGSGEVTIKIFDKFKKGAKIKKMATVEKLFRKTEEI